MIDFLLEEIMKRYVLVVLLKGNERMDGWVIFQGRDRAAQKKEDKEKRKLQERAISLYVLDASDTRHDSQGRKAGGGRRRG
jgi:hypothetical protein